MGPLCGLCIDQLIFDKARQELDVDLPSQFSADRRTKKIIAKPHIYVSLTKKSADKITVFQRLSQTADRLTQVTKSTEVSKPVKTTKSTSPDVSQIVNLFKPKDLLRLLRPLPTRTKRPAAATITAPTLSTVQVNSLAIPFIILARQPCKPSLLLVD